jgi:hypothetical protein
MTGSILVELGIPFSGPGYNNRIVEARHSDIHVEYTRRSSRGSTKGSGGESHYTIRNYQFVVTELGGVCAKVCK